MATDDSGRGDEGREEIPLVVFDCNLFLQAVGKGGNHAWKCLQLAIDGKLLVCMSEAVLEEIDEVLRRPSVREFFPMLDDARVDALANWLREFAVFLDPVPHVFDYPIDPKDEPYIDLAIAGGAVYLVSWDKHIKRLGSPKNPEGKRFMADYPDVSVLDPKGFLEAYFSTPEERERRMRERYGSALDPVEFRDACMEMMEEAHARSLEDASFVPSEFAPFYFIKRYEADERQAIPAAMRFWAFLEVLNADGLEEFMRPVDEQVKEIHVAVFEAVATVPLHGEEGFRVEELLADVRQRVGDIEAIVGLFGSSE